MKKPFIIGMAGGSGAGKTFILGKLREYLGEGALCIVSQDNYYRPANEQMRDENGQINFDRPEGVDGAGFLKDIDLLSKGQSVTRQEYMFNQPGVIGRILELKPAPVIIVEGLFIFHFPEIREILDMKIFIDSDHHTRLERRLERDTKERGVSEKTIRYQWQNHVIAAEVEFLLPYQGDVDLVIDNNRALDETIGKLAILIKDITLQINRG